MDNVKWDANFLFGPSSPIYIQQMNRLSPEKTKRQSNQFLQSSLSDQPTMANIPCAPVGHPRLNANVVKKQTRIPFAPSTIPFAISINWICIGLDAPRVPAMAAWVPEVRCRLAGIDHNYHKLSWKKFQHGAETDAHPFCQIDV